MTAPSMLDMALAAAHDLVDIGMPVFAARLRRDGNPDTRDFRWRTWQNTELDHDIIDSWRPGEALGAVCGVVFDSIDIDPRHGGTDSLRKLSKALGDNGPEVYGKVRTPSGGSHLYIASLGIRKCKPMPGIDLQAGDADGNGRGFVFIPPTVRPSKKTGEPQRYQWSEYPSHVSDGDTGCDALREYASQPAASNGSGVRRPASELRAACITADAGGQRPALLRYTHELERIGYDGDEIVADMLIPLVSEMPCYNEKDPWYPAVGRKRPDYHLRGLLHKKGAVAPDGRGELDGAAPIRKGRVTQGRVTRLSQVERKLVEWLWPGFLALGEFSLNDGEKGVGKSSIWYDAAARGSRGLPMPGQSEAACPPFNTLILSPENRASTVTRPRLEAAGADLDRVFIQSVHTSSKRGKDQVEDLYLLPGAADRIAGLIREADAKLLIIDPIGAFLEGTVNSHNDASVRTALSPLARVLDKLDCAAGFSRNMNKSSSQDASKRGSGSHAFSDMARVHLVSGRMPEDYTGKGEFGVGHAAVNLMRLPREVLPFSIVDSDIPIDNMGHYVSRIEWHDQADLDVNRLSRAENRPGPNAMRLEETKDILTEMFDRQDAWKAKDAKTEIAEAGGSTEEKLLAKAREALGIKSKKDGSTWVWTRADKIRPTRREK